MKELLLKEWSFQLVWVYIIANVDENVRIADLARHANISRQHAKRVLDWGIQTLKALNIPFSVKSDIDGFILSFTKNLLTTTETNSIIENKPAKKTINYEIHYKIIEYLNEKAGTAYKTNSKATLTLINARLEQKFSLDDFIIVIDKKVKEWQGTDSEKYLRPETLFNAKKFEAYLNQKQTNTPQNGQFNNTEQSKSISPLQRNLQMGANLVDKIFENSESGNPDE